MHSWAGVYLERQSGLHIATRRLFIMVNTRSCEMGGHVRRITLIHRLCSTIVLLQKQLQDYISYSWRNTDLRLLHQWRSLLTRNVVESESLYKSRKEMNEYLSLLECLITVLSQLVDNQRPMFELRNSNSPIFTDAWWATRGDTSNYFQTQSTR